MSDYFEHIDLIGTTALWSMRTRRNQILCPDTPLRYYRARERESLGTDPVVRSHPPAMGSTGAADVLPAADAPPAGETGGPGAKPGNEEEVQSEALPISVEETPADPEGAEELFTKEEQESFLAELQVFEDQTKRDLEPYQSSLTGVELPACTELDSEQMYEERVNAWVLGAPDDDRDNFQKIATILLRGARLKFGAWEKHTLELQKRQRLKLAEEDKSKDVMEPKAKRLRLEKESQERHQFYTSVVRALERMEKQMEHIPTWTPTEVATMASQMMKLLTAAELSSVRSESRIDALRRVISNVGWELRVGGVRSDALPKCVQDSSRLQKQPLREILLHSCGILQDTYKVSLTWAKLYEKKVELAKKSQSSFEEMVNLQRAGGTFQGSGPEYEGSRVSSHYGVPTTDADDASEFGAIDYADDASEFGAINYADDASEFGAITYADDASESAAINSSTGRASSVDHGSWNTQGC